MYWFMYFSRFLQIDKLNDIKHTATWLVDAAANSGQPSQLHLNKGLHGASDLARKLQEETSMHTTTLTSPGLFIWAVGVPNYTPELSDDMQVNAAKEAMPQIKSLCGDKGDKSWMTDCPYFDIILNEIYKISNETVGAGSYFNEGWYYEPNWQDMFWGQENYDRLLEIKKRVDPTDLFYCYHCVGSEGWSEDGSCRVRPSGIMGRFASVGSS